MYTKSEVLEFIEEEDVKFIRLAFFDLKGKQKNISIMPTELERAFEQGIPLMLLQLKALKVRRNLNFILSRILQHSQSFHGVLQLVKLSACSVIF